jgi:hypothetical protein
VSPGSRPTLDRTRDCTDVCALGDLPLTPTTTDLDPVPRPRPWLERSLAGVTNVPTGVTDTQALQEQEERASQERGHPRIIGPFPAFRHEPTHAPEAPRP